VADKQAEGSATGGCRKLDRLDRHEIIADPELGSIENSLRLPQSKSNA
jgi:hypothetical protein